MTRPNPWHQCGALLVMAALLLTATPLTVHAQSTVAGHTATIAIKRAASTADRVSANVARAESVTVPDDSPAKPEAAGAAPTQATASAVSAAPESRAAARHDAKESPMLSFDREVYNYAADGRRDPFQSLMATGELRPMITELRLVGIAYDATGGSVAVLRDLGTNEQYRVRTGQQLGRMRVAAIQPKKVVFTIEEFGFSRQESLALGDLTNARTQQ